MLKPDGCVGEGGGQILRRRAFLERSGAMYVLTTLWPRPTVIASPTSLQERIPRLLERHRVPGLAVALIRDGAVAWSGGFGVSDSVTRQPVTVETRFNAASLSKPAFAYAVLRLCERGTLDLDTPLLRYIPGPPPFLDAKDERLALVTARLVLSHRSGIPHKQPADGSPVRTSFVPGERFAYSWIGFAFLQWVVERLRQQSCDDFMREQLLDPFGMKASAFGTVWADPPSVPMASGHDRDGKPGISLGDKLRRLTPEQKDAVRTKTPLLDYTSSSGGLLTTATDYARFVAEMVAPAPADGFRLSEKTRAQMLVPQVRVADRLSWGIGWGLEHHEKLTWFWHWGDSGLIKNFVMASSDERQAVVVLTNGANGLEVYRQVVADVLGGKHRAIDWVEDY